MDFEHHYSRFPALAAYIDRVGAEQLNFKRFMIKEHHGHYYTEKYIIKLSEDFTITVSPHSEAHEPTEAEAAAIKAELAAVDFPKHKPASHGQVEQLLATGQVTGTLYEFWDSARKHIIMCQERRDLENGDKVYIPWTLYTSKGRDQWLQLEPDGPLPFWKPPKRRGKGSIMVHEGAKTAQFVDDLLNNPLRRSDRLSHPWAEEMEGYEHWGCIGGALAVHRTDFGELHREKLEGDVVYVCDNDPPGKDAAPVFSRLYSGRMRAIKFDNMFPVAWDLADPMPEKLFNRVGTCLRTLMSMAEPATWATKKVQGEKGRPRYVLTRQFAEEWHHAVMVDKFVHAFMPGWQFNNEKQFNKFVSQYSDLDDTARPVMKNSAGKAISLQYDPARLSGIFRDDDVTGASTRINTYVSSTIRDYTPIEAKRVDYSKFEKFMEHLAISLPLAASQMRAVWSVDAVTIREPSGLKVAESNWPPRPRTTAISFPVAASQMRAM
jgi:hypothetical protein